MTRLRLGAPLSLSGRYARFGRQAANGLKTWRTLGGRDVDLSVEDDASDPSRVADAIRRAAGSCDLLLGPYSTQLMREAGRAMADVDGLLWNHGGSGDDVQALCPGRIVSVLAPTSRYAQPFVRLLASKEPHAELWVVRGRGRFGRQVASGALREAELLGLVAVERDAREGGWPEDLPEPWDLFSVGTFEDDVEIVRTAKSASRPPRTLCSVAAGVRDCASMIEPDGIYGIAQWFPGRDERPEVGPTEAEFVAAYRSEAGSWPDYPAVQAIAAATLAVHCAELAASVEPDALWAAATSLRTSTLFGPFGVDEETGTQVRHAPVLLRWQAGQLELSRR
jgi:branched-chain amino acid transport system substrate-binding protein